VKEYIYLKEKNILNGKQVHKMDEQKTIPKIPLPNWMTYKYIPPEEIQINFEE